MTTDDRPRCDWPGTDPLNLEHHDVEWGVPSRDRRHLFELLTLEGAQAGLSWTTILRKRAGYVEAFAGFEPERVAALGLDDIERLMLDAGIIRNRAKIEATISNARLLLDLAPGEFDAFMWSFAPASHRPPATFADVPATTAASDALSKALRKRGFRFVGPTTMYALMQSAGMVDDHVEGCWRAAR